MLFNSYLFIFAFLPLTLFVYYLLGKPARHRFAIVWLIISSWFFYAWWNPPYLFLLWLSIGVNYGAGLWLIRNAGVSVSLKKIVLVVAIIFNLGLLAYFKYANFFVDNINTLIGSSFHLETIILPLAISFFTFQQIAYLVDAYRGRVKDPDLLNYCLFVSFFPQLISGPIVHHKEMMPQFSDANRFKLIQGNITIGFALFALGLFKKVVIADSMGDIADPMFSAAATLHAVDSIMAWSAILAYAFQIYFDFSGYTDMALGLGLMFGIRLPYNFNSPYKAANIFEFWNRWHMTLTRFMRNHVYLPLVRNRKFKPGHQMALVISVLLGGLWHGANWTFIAWGSLHATFMLINHAWHSIRRGLGHDLSKKTWQGIAAGILLTFVAGMFTRVFFRADSIDTALVVIHAMSGLAPTTAGYILPVGNLLWYVCLFILIWFAPNSQELLRQYQPGLNPNEYSSGRALGKTFSVVSLRFSMSIPWAVVIGVLFTISILNIDHTAPFVYFQF